MEQRPLRLGDIVDDYCPRERRITNHAIVALVGEEIRQTRCSTCDAEHGFKNGQPPRRATLRKKDGDAAGQLVTPRAAAAETPPGPVVPAEETGPDGAPVAMSALDDAPPDATPGDEPEGQPADADAWLAHRPLIRAQLPRTEGDPPAPRPIPEFTMHQRPTRGGRPFRQAQGWQGNGHAPNGFRHGRSGTGNAGGNQDRHGHGRQGQGGGRPGRHRGGNNKRSR
jgi:hypothetical protein